LDEVLRGLPIELRTVFVLHEIEEVQITEIATIEGIPTGTVNSRLRRAREMFSTICRRVQSAVRREQGSR
jgi:RNA polymerase sigma-70 factor (ECF subfamily)